MNAFNIPPVEVLFDYSLEQVDMLVKARIKRDEEIEDGAKKKKKGTVNTKPKAEQGTMIDLIRAFGKPRVSDG